MSKRSEARKRAVRALLVAVGYCGNCAREVRQLIRNASESEALRARLEEFFPHLAEDTSQHRIFDRIVAAFSAVLDLDSAALLSLERSHVFLFEQLTYIFEPSPRMMAVASHRLSNALHPAAVPMQRRKERRRRLQAVA